MKRAFLSSTPTAALALAALVAGCGGRSTGAVSSAACGDAWPKPDGE